MNNHITKTAETAFALQINDGQFRTAPTVTESILRSAQDGVFQMKPSVEKWKSTICQWWSVRHHCDITPESRAFCKDRNSAITAAIRRLTAVGENVLVQTPVSDSYFDSIESSGRRVLENGLKYRDSSYEVDWDDLEYKLSNPRTTLMLLCNPHSPIGMVWEIDTLQKIATLCQRYQVTVFSDESFCDLTELDIHYTPYASISNECAQNSVTYVTPMQAFNLFGLQTAAIMILDENLRLRIADELKADEPNFFAMNATVSAFESGETWLDTERARLSDVKKQIRLFMKDNLPQLRLVSSNQVDLLWLDCGRVSFSSQTLATFLSENAGISLTAGNSFKGQFDWFLCMNLRGVNQDAETVMSQLKMGIDSFEEWSASQC